MNYFKTSLFSLFMYFCLVCGQDYDTTESNFVDFFDEDLSEANNSENISIIYSTHYDIFETQITDNFSEQMNVRNIRNQLSDPTEVYYNVNGNYLIYEMIGFLYIYPLDVNKVNSLGLSGEHPLPTSVKANSQLNIDWIHDLFFWVKDKKQILVADVRQLNKVVVMANKLFDYIICLAVNPIDSFVIWFEFESENNEYILFKSLEDGSNRHSMMTFKTHIKRIEFDYQSKRIYFLSNTELSSTTYEGADRRTLVNQLHSIFQFEVLNDRIYWIEYHSNQLFRADLFDFKNSQKVLHFNYTINRFKLIDYWRQPIVINKCLNANCSDICLPVDMDYFRCVCHRDCEDNQDIQLAFNDQNLMKVSPSTPTSAINTTTTIQSQVSAKTHELNETNDNLISDPIEQIDSLSFNPKIVNKVVYKDPVIGFNDLDYLYAFKSSAKELSNPTTTEPLNTISSNKNVENLNSKELFDKSLYDLGSDPKNKTQNEDKYLSEKTNRNSKFLNVFISGNNSTQITIEKENNSSDIDSSKILINELKEEYEFHFIPKSLYHPLIYGFILLVMGLLIGTILSSIAIRIHGKQKCRHTYNTNTGTTNKWDSVAFKKAEQNIYFGAKYTVKDESLY